MIPRILIIAGSDSGGGAGIQADIKTVTMLGGHAMTAVTAVTAQNTLGVQAVHIVPTDIVIAQIEACVSDIGVDAVKIGMIGSAETADAVANYLDTLDVPVVFDPVMVATSGAVLADAATIAAFTRLANLATVITPNLPELEALGGDALLVGGTPVLVKGGHGEGNVLTDRLIEMGREVAHWSDARIDTPDTHGTGCTLASAIAVGLAEGMTLVDAIARARVFVRLALREAPNLGMGHGPMGHGKVRLDLGTGPRLNQVSIAAVDRASTQDFYETLGLTLIVDSANNGYQRFEAHGGATLSCYPEGEGIYFEFDDLDGEVAELEASGFVFDGDPSDRPWGWREAWLRDPAGNRICLYQAGENRRFPPWSV